MIHVQKGRGRVFHFGDPGVTFGHFGVEGIEREASENRDRKDEEKAEQDVSRHDRCSH